MVIWDCSEGHLYGLEKLWALLHYSDDHRYKKQLNEKLKKHLELYKTIEDFRVKVG